MAFTANLEKKTKKIDKKNSEKQRQIAKCERKIASKRISIQTPFSASTSKLK